MTQIIMGKSVFSSLSQCHPSSQGVSLCRSSPNGSFGFASVLIFRRCFFLQDLRRLSRPSTGIIYPSSLLHNTPNWYNTSLLSICTNREKSNQGLSKCLFFEINAKGRENIKPKAKGPHHQFSKMKL
jgi:hypothetical protein